LEVDTSELESRVKSRPLPAHVGIIMDGNGRWAESQKLPRIAGHREGSKSVREITRASRRLGIKALTLYAFSSQNWLRPPMEVAGLMDLLREYLIKERSEILDNGIRLEAIGDLKRLPGLVKQPLDELRRDSEHNTAMTLTLALSYGGREELVSAARAIADQVKDRSLAPSDVDEVVVQKALWSGSLPELDLVIRTSGERRLSNFMLWQAAYAELVFTDVLWPDFRVPELLRCIETYQQRERRFGLTSAQLRPAAT
jgi:undecaprenyl diphosphate synthase